VFLSSFSWLPASFWLLQLASARLNLVSGKFQLVLYRQQHHSSFLGFCVDIAGLCWLAVSYWLLQLASARLNLTSAKFQLVAEAQLAGSQPQGWQHLRSCKACFRLHGWFA
jgi:hypothetical protein